MSGILGDIESACTQAVRAGRILERVRLPKLAFLDAADDLLTLEKTRNPGFVGPRPTGSILLFTAAGVVEVVRDDGLPIGAMVLDDRARRCERAATSCEGGPT